MSDEIGSRFLDTNYGSADVVLLTIYTAITTGLGRRTLGEEYTNIHQWKGHRSLSWKMRLLLVLSIPAPHILKYLLSRSRHSVINRLSPPFQTALRGTLSVLSSNTTWDLARTLNLIAFYLGSKFHTIKNRIFQIRYIDTSPAEQQRIEKPFELLGYMLSIRLALQLAGLAKPYLPQIPLNTVEVPAVTIDGQKVDLIGVSGPEGSSESAEDSYSADTHTCLATEDREQADDAGQRKCTLCLENRTATSAMLCGHLYCWSCVDSWLREKVGYIRIPKDLLKVYRMNARYAGSTLHTKTLYQCTTCNLINKIYDSCII